MSFKGERIVQTTRTQIVQRWKRAERNRSAIWSLITPHLMILQAMLGAISSDKPLILKLKRALTSIKKDLEKEISSARLKARETSSSRNLLNTSKNHKTSTKTQNLESVKATSPCRIAAITLTRHLRWTSMKKWAWSKISGSKRLSFTKTFLS